MNNFITYLESNQPIATILTGVLAITAVLISQVWLDSRQKKDHQHTIDLNARERLLTIKEGLIDTIGTQIRDISQVEVDFDSWHDDFEINYSNSRINLLLRVIDIRLDKIHLQIKQYFPGHISFIDKITNESQGFHELSADFAMAAKFGKHDFLALNHIEIFEVCNSYAVSYMQLSSLLVGRTEN